MKFLMFDFDGVMVSSFSLAYETMKQIGAAPSTEEQYRDYFNGDVYKAVGPTVGGPESRVAEPTPFFKLYGPELLKKKMTPGMAELIRALKSNGHSMVIISSTMDDIIDGFLGAQGIRDCFSKIYGATYHKDKVFKIGRALEDADVAPVDAFFITDTLGDLYDAAECHVPAIAVTWGYHPIETLQKGKPMAIVGTVDELREIVSQSFV